MDKYFAIPTEYIRKYTSNNTTSEEVRDFVNEIITSWEDEDPCVYEHYAELEEICKGADV